MSKELLREYDQEQAGRIVGWYQFVPNPRDDHGLDLSLAYGEVCNTGASYVVDEEDSGVTHEVRGFKDCKRLQLGFRVVENIPVFRDSGFGGTHFWSDDDKVFSMESAGVDIGTVNWFDSNQTLPNMLKEDCGALGLDDDKSTYSIIYYHLNALVLHKALARGFSTFGSYTLSNNIDWAFADPAMAETTAQEILTTEEILDLLAEVEATNYQNARDIGSVESGDEEGRLRFVIESELGASELEASILTAAGKLVVPNLVYVGYNALTVGSARTGAISSQRSDNARSQSSNVSLTTGEQFLADQSFFADRAKALKGRKSFAEKGHAALARLSYLEQK